MVYFNKKAGKITIILPGREKDEGEDEIIELPDERAYYDETNKAIIELKKRIDSTGIRECDIVDIKALKEAIIGHFNEWQLIQLTLEGMIEERTTFVTQGNFYPKEYVYDINRMRTKKEKAREYQMMNPLKPLKEVNEFIKEQNEKVAIYKEIKEKVEAMLVNLETYESNLKYKKDQVLYFSKKQELFIHLQNGELKEAKKLLKYFNSKIKTIK